MERPRSFKLEMFQASEQKRRRHRIERREFWFWFTNKKDKSVYFCNYDDLSSTSLAVTYQPDWIVEAMGLKPITPEEAAQIKVRPGPAAGNDRASHSRRHGTGGQTYSRVMIVSDRTRRVQEFRVKRADGKTVIAQATIKKYRDLPVGRRAANESQADPGAGEPASCPRTSSSNGRRSSSPSTWRSGRSRSTSLTRPGVLHSSSSPRPADMPG